MRLLIIGALDGQLSEATKLAMQGGAKVAHAASIEIALHALRTGYRRIGVVRHALRVHPLPHRRSQRRAREQRE